MYIFYYKILKRGICSFTSYHLQTLVNTVDATRGVFPLLCIYIEDTFENSVCI